MQMLETRTCQRAVARGPVVMPSVRLMPVTLINGERLSQSEFHQRYESYPDNLKFELVKGMVYMASPMRREHGVYHTKLSYAFEHFAAATAGIEVLDNSTAILDKDSEPQPDLSLRIVPECGGHSTVNAGGYVTGPPELVAEIAHSTRDLDLHEKREDYERTGVLEYVVLCVEERELHWFHFSSGEMIRPGREGISRSREFPGLWIDVAALLDQDTKRLRAAVERGVARREHAVFCRKLKAAKK